MRFGVDCRRQRRQLREDGVHGRVRRARLRNTAKSFPRHRGNSCVGDATDEQIFPVGDSQRRDYSGISRRRLHHWPEDCGRVGRGWCACVAWIDSVACDACSSGNDCRATCEVRLLERSDDTRRPWRLGPSHANIWQHGSRDLSRVRSPNRRGSSCRRRFHHPSQDSADNHLVVQRQCCFYER